MPLLSIQKFEKALGIIGADYVKSKKEWIVLYKGKPITTIAIKHKGEKGVKIQYIWYILKEKLKSDGLIEGTEEYKIALAESKK